MLLTDAGRLATGMAPPPSPVLYLVLVQLKIVATAFALSGFGAYVLFLHTGRKMPSLAGPVVVGLVYMYFFLAITHARLPLTIEVGTWATRMHLQPGSIFPGGEAVGVTLFFLPLIMVVFLYLSLWRRLATQVQHLRLVSVSVSLLVFLVAASVQSNPDASPDSAVLPLTLVVILCTGLFSLAVFRPPAWLERRLRAPVPQPA